MRVLSCAAGDVRVGRGPGAAIVRARVGVERPVVAPVVAFVRRVLVPCIIAVFERLDGIGGEVVMMHGVFVRRVEEHAVGVPLDQIICDRIVVRTVDMDAAVCVRHDGVARDGILAMVQMDPIDVYPVHRAAHHRVGRDLIAEPEHVDAGPVRPLPCYPVPRPHDAAVGEDVVL